MIKRNTQAGFGIVGIVIVIVVLAVIGGLGWVVYKNFVQKPSNATSSTSSNSTKPNTPAAPSNPNDMASMANGSVTFSYLKSEWSLVPDTASTYYTKQNHLCGQPAMASDIQCLDVHTLALAKEGFTNPDQFLVTVGVLKNDGKTAQQWFDTSGVSEGGAMNTKQALTINGNSAYLESAGYGADETRLTWVIASDKYVALVKTVLFRGDHYSFHGANDYFTYRKDVEAIVNSIHVN